MRAGLKLACNAVLQALLESFSVMRMWFCPERMLCISYWIRRIPGGRGRGRGGDKTIWPWKYNFYCSVLQVSSKITQENMEAAYLNDEQVYFFHIDKFNYMITFYEKSMYQRNMNPSYFTKRDVRRRPQFVAESELQSQERWVHIVKRTNVVMQTKWTRRDMCQGRIVPLT